MRGTVADLDLIRGPLRLKHELGRSEAVWQRVGREGLGSEPCWKAAEKIGSLVPSLA